MNLDGKVALITGAASGIGHAIAKRYLEADGRVVIADLNADGAKAAAKELAREKSAIGVGMDVSKEDEVNAGVEQTIKTFGRVDILVSNAGIQIVHPVEEFPFANWRKMLAIHLDGAFLTTRRASSTCTSRIAACCSIWDRCIATRLPRSRSLTLPLSTDFSVLLALWPRKARTTMCALMSSAQALF
jgi:NAD(P)-dependent dehydrogenase (short-subunit alcohol dehydrogenase family)